MKSTKIISAISVIALFLAGQLAEAGGWKQCCYQKKHGVVMAGPGVAPGMAPGAAPGISATQVVQIGRRLLPVVQTLLDPNAMTSGGSSTAVVNRLDQMNASLEKINKRLESLDTIDSKLDRILAKLDGVDPSKNGANRLTEPQLIVIEDPAKRTPEIKDSMDAVRDAFFKRYQTEWKLYDKDQEFAGEPPKAAATAMNEAKKNSGPYPFVVITSDNQVAHTGSLPADQSRILGFIKEGK